MTQPQQVDLYFSYRVKEGMDELFEEYLATVLPVTEEQEPYVLEYHLFRNGEGTVFQHERYADEQAIRDHLRVTADGQAAWAAATELLEIRMVGPLSQAFVDEFPVPASALFERFREVAR